MSDADTATELSKLAHTAMAVADGDDAAEDTLPPGYRLVIAVRDSDQPCDTCTGSDAHNHSQMAILTRMRPEATLEALSAAMRQVGESAGINVGIVDPQQLLSSLLLGAMGGGYQPGGDQPGADDGPAPGTGQYL